MPDKISRRRMISIIAGASVGGYSIFGTPTVASTTEPYMWRGVVLGGEAVIKLYGDDKDKVTNILDKCRREISRLENMFSLYRSDSQINKLNRDGKLAYPEFDLLDLFSKSNVISHHTNGAFDITVQPLWQLYRDHFKGQYTNRSGPDRKAIQEALRLIDYRLVGLSPEKIVLPRSGMAVTLNGIAQGYITDRIAKLMKTAGWSDVLINLGEVYAMGEKPGGERWRAAIANPADPLSTVKDITLKDRALATSGGYGTRFSRDGIHHHLFDPATGHSTQHYKSVSVIAPQAAIADGLSTAFSAMPISGIETVLKRYSDTSVIIVGNDDRVVVLS